MNKSHIALRLTMGFVFAAMLTASVKYFAEHDVLMTHNHKPADNTSVASQETPHGIVKNSTAATGEHDDRTHVLHLMSELKKNPNNAEILMMISEHFLASNDFPMAETFAGRIIKVDPNNPDALYIRGIARHRLNRHAEAAEDLELVKNIRDDYSVRYSLGILYVHFLDNKTKGYEHLTKALTFPSIPPNLENAVKAELNALK